MQLIAYLNGLGLLPSLQSGSRAGHSTETVLVRLLSDIFSATDRGEVTLMALLDVSAACDSVDHDILLMRLRRTYGMDGHVLSRLESFIRGRTQSVAIGGQRFGWRTIHFGVPQDSVLGPLLYVPFTADKSQIIQSSGLNDHQYADDVQVYVHYRGTEVVGAFDRLNMELESLHC